LTASSTKRPLIPLPFKSFFFLKQRFYL